MHCSCNLSGPNVSSSQKLAWGSKFVHVCLGSPEASRAGRCGSGLVWSEVRNRGWWEGDQVKSWVFFGKGMRMATFGFQSPAVHWMARTSSLNCLYCRNSAAEKRGLWEGVVQEPLRRALFCVFLCSEVIFSCKSHRNFFQKLPLQCRHFLENPLAKNPKTQLLIRRIPFQKLSTS